MLVALHVRDFVLIDNLELRLEPGFNVLTGETGAGKSIIIGALHLVLGGRARADVVRAGAKEAVVEALFDARHAHGLAARLERAGIPLEDELVVRRIVQKSGRSRAYVNGRLCTIGELAALAPMLADVTSQHESVALTDPRRHIEYLDRYADVLPLRAEVAGIVDDLGDVVERMAELRGHERDRTEREAFLRYQLGLISDLNPHAGELDELRQERSRLKHAGRLAEVTTTTAIELEGDSGLCDRLGTASAALTSASELDNLLEPWATELDDCWSRLREVAQELARYAERVEQNPARLEEVQERMFRLDGLLRQLGPTLDDVLSARTRIDGELEALTAADAQLPELEKRRAALHVRASKMARRLSRKRRDVATKLGRAISDELRELGMGAARVVVDVARAIDESAVLAVDGARLGRHGIDRVQFLIAPNRGCEPRPLAKIASGGELSRALLALKRALYTHSRRPERKRARGDDAAIDDAAIDDAHGPMGALGVQVFDEVDSGVGGDTAARIGRAMADIAQHRQVLCITHMASIAVYADAHFVVTKTHSKTNTTSDIGRVDGESRVREVARMLTGAKLTTSSQRAARELLADRAA